MVLNFRKEYKALVTVTLLISIRQMHCFCYRSKYGLLIVILLICFQARGQSGASSLQISTSVPENKYDSIYYELFKLNKTSDIQKAIHYSKLAYHLSSRYKHFSLQINLCYDLANFYDANKKPDSSVIYFHKAIQLSSLNKSNDWLIYLYNDLGLHHQRLDVYDSALHYFLLSYNLANENQSYESQAAASHNIGLVNSYLMNYSDAIFYFKESIAIKTKNRITKDLVLNYLNLARAYNEQGSYKEALEQLRILESNCKTGCDDAVLADLYYGLGHSSLKNGSTSGAYNFFKKALALARKNNNNKQTLANTLFHLSIFASNRRAYAEALEYLGESEKIAQEINHRRLLRDVYNQLSIVYDKTGSTSKTLHYQKLYWQLKDDIFNEGVANNVKNIQLSEQRKQSDAIIKEKETELWGAYIITLLYVLIFILMCIVVYLVFKALVISRQHRAKLEADILQMRVDRILKK